MDFDIAIVGGGLVGAAAAVACAQQHFRVILLDQQAAPQMHLPEQRISDDWDSRIYAISPGNSRWLQTLGVWQRMPVDRVCEMAGMEIWGDASRAPLSFDAYAANAENLGFILESRELLRALWLQMQNLGVTLQTGVACSALQRHADFGAGSSAGSSLIKLANGEAVTAELVIAADGAHSWVRQQAGIAVQYYDYQQMGMVANFDTERPHQHIARQWFTEEGILAWLPLPGNRISMVWSTQQSDELLALSPAALASKVQEAGHHSLGSLRSISPVKAFKLVKQTAAANVQEGLVLLGDAAHQLHPLAGQGVNLGFRDVIALQQTLSSRSPSQHIGELGLLRRYERSRKADVMALATLTHALQQLFNNDKPLLKTLRNVGLDMVNRQQGLKRRLIKNALI